MSSGRAAQFTSTKRPVFRRLAAVSAGGVERAGDEFLAGAAFAEDQDAAVRRRGDGDLLAQRFHRNAFTDDLIAMAQLATQELIFFLQAALLDGVADEHDDFFERERLLDEIEGAELGGAHGGFDR